MAKKIRSKDIKDSKRRKLLGFPDLPKTDATTDSKHQFNVLPKEEHQ